MYAYFRDFIFLQKIFVRIVRDIFLLFPNKGFIGQAFYFGQNCICYGYPQKPDTT